MRFLQLSHLGDLDEPCQLILSIPQFSWDDITSNLNVQQNQDHPLKATCVDINFGKFQNPTLSSFWENQVWIL